MTERKLFRVRALEHELHEYVYYVDARSPREAEDTVRDGGVDYAGHYYLDGEIVKVEVKEVSGDDH